MNRRQLLAGVGGAAATWPQRVLASQQAAAAGATGGHAPGTAH